jgi:predicted regulator of Ras-like GTPase activity (Roadblock/LC7/MglB family)
MSVSLILFEDDSVRIVDVCERLNRDACARAVFLVEKDGQLIASAGATQDFDLMSLASLTAGNMAATNGLANLLGEQGFDSQFHAGIREHIHISTIGDRMILVVIFNDRSSLGLVRLKIDQAASALVSVIDSVLTRSEAVDVPSVGYTDNEIDRMLDDE